MGSRCRIVLYAESESKAARAASTAFTEIADVESVLSDYRSNSESMQATSHPAGTWVAVSPMFLEVLEKCEELHELSKGAFDPTVGSYTHLWRAARNDSQIPTTAELDSARHAVGWSKLEIDSDSSSVRFKRAGMVLDFGGIGKGYAADRAYEALQRLGISAALIDVGGDLLIGDPPPDQQDGWLVTIETGVAEPWTTRIQNAAVATSGDRERFYEHEGVRYSHILDPRTGVGIVRQPAVTVIARNGALADAYASIVSVMGREGVELLTEHDADLRVYLIER
ncbi:MAG: FAD:protein FMN transferase [Phycisphaerales bacterium]|nr:FAD:protein FMN transferase [Phycisphaerales bacterium]